jgi:ATP:ADP antiporter, AAA family
MLSFFGRVFKIQPGEARLVLLLGLLLGGHSFVLEINEIIATSGFLSQVSVDNMLLVWSIAMSLIMVSGTLQSFILDRYNRKVLLLGVCLIVTLIYALLAGIFLSGVPDWVIYSLLFVVSDQQWLFVPLIFWVLANDLFSMAQAKRLFPLIISMSFIGQIGGIILSATAPNLLSGLHLTTLGFLGINAVIFALLSLVVWRFLPASKHTAVPAPDSVSIRQTLSEGWEFVRNVPSFRYMCLAYLGLAIAITVARFHFLVISDRELVNASDFQTFYATYRLTIVILSIVMTAFITSRLMKWLRLQDVFLVTPGGILLIMLGMLLLGGLLVSTGGIVMVWVLYNSVDQSARKSLQALVPEERQGRVSLFIDSYVPALGVILAALLITAILRLTPLLGLRDAAPIYLGLGVVVTLGSIGAALKLRQVYDASLLNWRIKRRRRASSLLEQLEL